MQHRLRLAHQRRVLGVNTIIPTIGGETKPSSGLLQGRLRLLHAQAKIGRIKPCDDLALAHPAAQIDSDFTEPPIDLET
jgi:hypothetical protein